GRRPAARAELLPLVYNELRQLAGSQLACEKPGQTLDATALVHEAYLRLVGQPPCGECSQLIVDDGQQLPGRLAVARVDGLEETGHVGHRVEVMVRSLFRQRK